MNKRANQLIATTGMVAALGGMVWFAHEVINEADTMQQAGRIEYCLGENPHKAIVDKVLLQCLHDGSVQEGIPGATVTRSFTEGESTSNVSDYRLDALLKANNGDNETPASIVVIVGAAACVTGLFREVSERRNE